MSAFCPVSATAKILAARWTFEIIYHLRQPRRFCELQELVGGVNPRTFSERLKFLEEQGLVSRQPFAGGSRAVQYRLTEQGEELLPILDDLSSWADRWVNTEAAGNETGSQVESGRTQKNRRTQKAVQAEGQTLGGK